VRAAWVAQRGLYQRHHNAHVDAEVATSSQRTSAKDVGVGGPAFARKAKSEGSRGETGMEIRLVVSRSSRTCNLTPVIDCVFLLLIFFMVTTVFNQA
jgi:hypothetical protein